MPPKNGRVEVESDRCKACGLCVHFCPKQCFTLGDSRNSTGSTYVLFLEESDCTACGICALVCPDLALRVYNLRAQAEPQETLR